MAPVTERALIERLVAGMPRSAHQVNRLHESDAELLRIPGTEVVLALTTDSVVEEITSGLYTDPYLAGWMAVTVSASDLAAVGAEQLGLLVSEALPPGMSAADVARLQAGIRDAARAHELPVLGGDTSASPSLQLTATAVGVVRTTSPLTRCGAQPGDRLFASGPLGLGAAFAFRQLLGAPRGDGAPLRFQPVARLREGRLIARWASACMDTSDGAIATIDELMRINDVGVRLCVTWDRVLDPAAFATAVDAGLPPWTMLAGPHGEFELLFAIPSHRREAFCHEAAAMGWRPIELGDVVRDPGFSCRLGAAWHLFDTARIRNLFTAVHGDPRRYLTELVGSAAPRGAPVRDRGAARRSR